MNQNCKKIFAKLCISIAAFGFVALGCSVYASGTGSGSMEGIVPDDVFRVVLPSDPGVIINQGEPIPKIFDFILDPNLIAKDKYPDMSIEQNKTLLFKNNSGSYDYSHISDSLTVQNKSTMNVDIKLDATLSGMDNLLTNDSAFNDDKTTSVYLAMMDSNNKVSVVDKYGAFLRKTLSGKPDAYKYDIDKTTGKYVYILKSDQELQNDNIEFENYSFQLTGDCNSAGDWSKFVEPASSRLTVTWKVSPRPAALPPSIGKTSYLMTKNISNIVDVDLGEGNLAASDISSITYKNVSGATISLDKGNYIFVDDTLTFNAAYITSMINAGVISRSHTITFNDKASTRIVVTLTVNDIAPSIGQTSFDMTKGQAVLVNVDLGSGNLRARGIKSITFTNPSGVLKTLETRFYKLDNGVLEFNPLAINTLLENGIASRTFTVNLDDKAETKWQITLSAEGVSPSIGVKTYSVLKDQSILIDVNLGSGYLGASSVSSITFKNASGVVKTLENKYYSFGNGRLELTSEAANILINGGVISRTYSITFDDVLKTCIPITLNVVGVSPTLVNDSYEINNGFPVWIDGDLGAGDLRATGIKSVTYVNPAGNRKTLETSFYTITNGKLKFTVGTIATLLKNGITSRTFKVVLNDKNSTEWDITLYTNSTPPAIATKTYSVNKVESVPINVDLGFGDLAATDIQLITFANPSGIVKTLETGFYSFDKGILEFNSATVNTLITNGIASRDFTIIFNNIAKTSIPITLNINVPVKAPSIASGSYKMISGYPVLVDVDLGTGSLKATGIKSISFVNPSGVTKILERQYYVLSDNKLKFTVAAVNVLLNGGITSRTFTVTFNDNAGTKATITLTK